MTSSSASADKLMWVDYSDKAIAVFDNGPEQVTKQYKDKLKALGGRFNPALSLLDKKLPGWVFSKTKKPEVIEFLTLVNKNPTGISKLTLQDTCKSSSDAPVINYRDYMALCQRVQKLEEELEQCKKTIFDIQSLDLNNDS